MGTQAVASPHITVFVPARNEERSIEECLRGILAQEYPHDRMEIIVADGASEDATRAIVERVAADSPVPISVVDNPGRTVPAGINRALRRARGEFLVRIDARTIPKPGYIRGVIDGCVEHDAALCGGWIEPVGRGAFDTAVAAALRSPFAMGNTPVWQPPARARDVVSVPCGTYRLSALASIGGYDEEQAINEDYEANYRLKKAGHRVVQLASVSQTYFPRGSVGALAHQFWRYGFFKARVMIKHPASNRLRHFVPAMFVATLGALAVAAPLSRTASLLLLAVLGLYVAALVVASVAAARDAGRFAVLLPVVFATMHLVWGAGNLVGLVRWLPTRPWALPPQPALSLEGR